MNDNSAAPIRFRSNTWLFLLPMPVGVWITYIDGGAGPALIICLGYLFFVGNFCHAVTVHRRQIVLGRYGGLKKIMILDSEVKRICLKEASYRWDYIEIITRRRAPVRIYRGACANFDGLVDALNGYYMGGANGES